MGAVVEIVHEIKDCFEDAVQELFGESRHRSGPMRTYRKQHEWDKKRAELQQARSQLDNERELFVMDSYRVPSLTAKKEELQARLQLVKEKLAAHREKILEESKRLQDEQDQNTCVSFLNQCLRSARQTIESLNENCPQLVRVTEEMADAYCSEIQQRTDENSKELDNLHQLKVKEKLVKQQGYQEARSQKQQLQKVITQLSALENKIK